MIRVGDKKVKRIYAQGRRVISVYIRGRLIWPELIDNLLSCFYNGYWIDEYPWTDDLPWTD